MRIARVNDSWIIVHFGNWHLPLSYFLKIIERYSILVGSFFVARHWLHGLTLQIKMLLYKLQPLRKYVNIVLGHVLQVV